MGLGTRSYVKNTQTTIALTFLAHIISGIDGVASLIQPLMYNDSFIVSEYCLETCLPWPTPS